MLLNGYLAIVHNIALFFGCPLLLANSTLTFVTDPRELCGASYFKYLVQ